MGVVTLILVFIIVWWLCFFMILPIGQKPSRDPPEPGHAPSAPDKPRLWRRAGFTTLAAVIVTAIIVVIVKADIISFVRFDEMP